MVWPVRGPGLQTIRASLYVSLPSPGLLSPRSPPPRLEVQFLILTAAASSAQVLWHLGACSLQTLKLSFIFSSTRLSEPTVPVSQAKSHRDNLGQDTLSVGLVGCRRDEDAGGAVAPFGPPYRALYL